MDEFDELAWSQFVNQPFNPNLDWRAVAADLRKRASALHTNGGSNVIPFAPRDMRVKRQKS